MMIIIAGENVAITLDEQLFVDKGNLISHTSKILLK